MPGPLHGIRIVEIAGLGPGPFAAMMLADHGAEVVRIDRPGAAAAPNDPLLRSRKSVTLDLKSVAGVAALRALCRSADGLIEGFRPGVMERLGLGPDVLLADNPKLVYGRMTGWGQVGPNAMRAGHDINYIALSGALGVIGRVGEAPTPPLNLVGDFGGGGMMLAFAMVAAILAVQRGGDGQVIDCAMTDGSALLMSMIWGFRADGSWAESRGVNLLDTGAPFYDTYETGDGGFVSIGSIEPQFYAILRERLGIADDADFDVQTDRLCWVAQKRKLAAIFRGKTRAEWCARLEDTDACFAPVLSMTESLNHPHNVARGTFVDVGGVVQPAPAPRYSRTVCAHPEPPRQPGEDTAMMLGSLMAETRRVRS
jgi:alpha-methylacyl-CoA racemase